MNRSELEEEDLSAYKIIIVGQTKVGKTKLLIRYKFGTYQDSGTITVGVDSHIVRTQKAKFRYFDTAGQEYYRAIVDTYYRGSDACLICYDVTSRQSFQEIGYYYNKVKELSPESLIFLIGCKADLDYSVFEDEVRKTYKGIDVKVTSSKTNLNVKEVFENVENQLIEKKPKQKKKPKFNKLSFMETQKKNNQIKCCQN